LPSIEILLKGKYFKLVLFPKVVYRYIMNLETIVYSMDLIAFGRDCNVQEKE